MPLVRTLFLSDIHLGTRACQAERFLDFLREHPSEQTYLIGDIVDFWAMHRGVCWTSAQNTVVQKLLRRARHGERIVFIPGNHDEALRDYLDVSFGDIEVREEAIHETLDGRRLLLVHGDAFDQVTRHHRWVAVLGDVAYNQLVRLNLWLSWLRRSLGIAGYWSLAGYAKRKVKTALSFIFDFEDSAVHHARERGLDGIVCGHIHWAAIKQIDGRGRRLAVEHVLGMLAAGDDMDTLLDGYRWLEREDILSCLAYAHRLVEHERVEPLIVDAAA